MKTFKASLALGCLAAPATAQAELPEAVQAMIDAAIESSDADAVRTVIGLARQTNPDDAEQLDAQLAEFNAAQRELAAEEAAAKKEEIRQAGLFDNWSGKGELGAFRATGNSSNTGLSAGLSLDPEGH